MGQELDVLTPEIQACEISGTEINGIMILQSRTTDLHVWATSSGSNGTSHKIYLRKNSQVGVIEAGSHDINYLYIGNER